MGRNVRDIVGLRGDEAGQLAIEDERAEAGKFRQMMHEERPYSSFVGSILPTAPLALLSGGAAPAAMAAGSARWAAAGANAGLGALQSQEGDYLSDAAMGGVALLGRHRREQYGQAGRPQGDPGRAPGRDATRQSDRGSRILVGAERAGMTDAGPAGG